MSSTKRLGIWVHIFVWAASILALTIGLSVERWSSLSQGSPTPSVRASVVDDLAYRLTRGSPVPSSDVKSVLAAELDTSTDMVFVRPTSTVLDDSHSLLADADVFIYAKSPWLLYLSPALASALSFSVLAPRQTLLLNVSIDPLLHQLSACSPGTPFSASPSDFESLAWPPPDDTGARELTIVVGGTVQWTINPVASTHVLRSSQVGPGPNEFQSPELTNGSSYNFTFSTTGTYGYYDDRIPLAFGVVKVLDRPLFANTWPRVSQTIVVRPFAEIVFEFTDSKQHQLRCLVNCTQVEIVPPADSSIMKFARVRVSKADGLILVDVADPSVRVMIVLDGSASPKPPIDQHDECAMQLFRYAVLLTRQMGSLDESGAWAMIPGDSDEGLKYISQHSDISNVTAAELLEPVALHQMPDYQAYEAILILAVVLSAVFAAGVSVLLRVTLLSAESVKETVVRHVDTRSYEVVPSHADLKELLARDPDGPPPLANLDSLKSARSACSMISVEKFHDTAGFVQRHLKSPELNGLRLIPWFHWAPQLVWCLIARGDAQSPFFIMRQCLWPRALANGELESGSHPETSGPFETWMKWLLVDVVLLSTVFGIPVVFAVLLDTEKTRLGDLGGTSYTDFQLGFEILFIAVLPVLLMLFAAAESVRALCLTPCHGCRAPTAAKDVSSRQWAFWSNAIWGAVWLSIAGSLCVLMLMVVFVVAASFPNTEQAIPSLAALFFVPVAGYNVVRTLRAGSASQAAKFANVFKALGKLKQSVYDLKLVKLRKSLVPPVPPPQWLTDLLKAHTEGNRVALEQNHHGDEILAGNPGAVRPIEQWIDVFGGDQAAARLNMSLEDSLKPWYPTKAPRSAVAQRVQAGLHLNLDPSEGKTLTPTVRDALRQFSRHLSQPGDAGPALGPKMIELAQYWTGPVLADAVLPPLSLVVMDLAAASRSWQLWLRFLSWVLRGARPAASDTVLLIAGLEVPYALEAAQRGGLLNRRPVPTTVLRMPSAARRTSTFWFLASQDLDSETARTAGMHPGASVNAYTAAATAKTVQDLKVDGEREIPNMVFRYVYYSCLDPKRVERKWYPLPALNPSALPAETRSTVLLYGGQALLESEHGPYWIQALQKLDAEAPQAYLRDVLGRDWNDDVVGAVEKKSTSVVALEKKLLALVPKAQASNAKVGAVAFLTIVWASLLVAVILLAANVLGIDDETFGAVLTSVLSILAAFGVNRTVLQNTDIANPISRDALAAEIKKKLDLDLSSAVTEIQGLFQSLSGAVPKDVQAQLDVLQTAMESLESETAAAAAEV